MTMNIGQEIADIKKRNAKVEGDKARETSRTRRGLIAFLTYLVVVLFFVTVQFPKPFLSAIVPTFGFLLSTLSLEMIKKKWIAVYSSKYPVACDGDKKEEFMHSSSL